MLGRLGVGPAAQYIILDLISAHHSMQLFQCVSHVSTHGLKVAAISHTHTTASKSRKRDSSPSISLSFYQGVKSFPVSFLQTSPHALLPTFKPISGKRKKWTCFDWFLQSCVVLWKEPSFLEPPILEGGDMSIRWVSQLGFSKG